MADGSVKILTALDNTGLEKGIKSMNSKVAAGAGKAAETLKSGLKISAGVISAVAGGIGALAAKGIQYNSQIEQLQTSFEVMLGSADKAKKMISDMNNFAAVTPFQTNDLADAGKVLMGYGVQGKDVMNTLKMLGDVSQGNAEKLKGLSLVYGQIMANGKLQGQDLLQLISNGFNPLLTILPKVNANMAEYKKRALEAGMTEKAWNKIAADGKVSMSELRDMMSKGAISAQDVSDAFKAVTSKGGMFYNDMEKQSHTFNGQVSTLKDNVNMFLGDLTKGLQAAAKDDALPKINQYMESLNKALKSGGTAGVAKEFGSVAADAVKQIAAVTPDVVKTSSSIIKSFADGISDNAPEISKSAVAIGKSLIDGIGEILPAIGKAAGGLVKGIVGALAGADAANAVQETIDNIGNAFNSLKEAAAPAIQAVVQIISGLSSTIANISSVVLPLLTNALKFAAENMQTILPIVAGVVAGIKGFEAAKAAAVAVKALSASLKAMAAAESVAGAAAAVAGGPIALLTGLAVGLGAAFVTAAANSDGFDSSQKKLERSSEALGKSYSDVVKGLDDFKDGVQSADSILKDMNTDLIVSSSDSKKVSDGMKSVQSEINEIAKKASDERRALTDGEIQKLNDLFKKMHELAQQQTAQNKAYQDAVRSRAVDAGSDTSMSSDQYQQESNKIIKAASERKQATIDAAESQYENEYALVQKRTDLSSAAKEKLINDAKATRQATVDSANKEAAQTVSILANGYTKHSADLQAYVTKTQQANSAVDAENQRHAQTVAGYTAEYQKVIKSQTATQYDRMLAEQKYNQASESEEKLHSNTLRNLQNSENQLLDSSTKKQLSTLLGYVVQSRAAYNKLDSSTQDAIKSMMTQFKNLGPEGQKEINDMLDKMGLELESNGDIVYKAGDKAGQVVLKMDEVMKSGTLHAPSNLDDSDLIRKAGESAQAALTRIKGILSDSTIDVHAKVAIESYAVGSRPISGQLQAGVGYTANGDIKTSPTLTWVAEAGYPEAIIPFDPARRGRALQLFRQTGKALGVMENANGGIYGTLPSNPKVSVSTSMMSSILGWAKINTGKDDKLSDKIVEQAQKTLDNLKQYDELSTAEEVRFWEQVKKIRGLAGDQLNEIDHKIYDAKKANSEAIVSDAEKYLSHYQNIGQMTSEWELSYWQKTLNREGLFADQKQEIQEKIYAAKKQVSADLLSDSEKFVEKQEFYNKISAEDEVTYWQNVLKDKRLAADEIESINEKIYTAEQKAKEELSQKSKNNYDYFNGFIQDDKDFDRIDTKGELARWKSIYDDYKNGLIFLQADEVKQIEKNIHSLQKEVDSTAQQAQDTAKQNWQSRVDSLKSWSGMFDEPSYNYETSKEELMWNMQEQVRMMQDWQSDLANLQARGISSAMAKELENLGPASADKIRALSEMTDEELQKYSNLYATKGSLATGQANAETGITSTVTDSAAVAVTQSVSSLSDAVQQQLPNLTSQFQQGGTDAGNAYGTAFVARVKSAMNDFSSIVQSSVSGAQVQLNSTMQAANAASSAIDRLNAKVSGMKVEQVQQVTQLSMSGRQVAKAIAPYAGTYLKLNGG